MTPEHSIARNLEPPSRAARVNSELHRLTLRSLREQGPSGFYTREDYK